MGIPLPNMIKIHRLSIMSDTLQHRELNNHCGVQSISPAIMLLELSCEFSQTVSQGHVSCSICMLFLEQTQGRGCILTSSTCGIDVVATLPTSIASHVHLPGIKEELLANPRAIVCFLTG